MDPNIPLPASPAANVPLEPSKKPISMWIMQIVTGLSLPILLLYAALAALYTLPQDGHEGSPGSGIFALILLLFFFPWSLSIFLNVARRKPTARWLGGALILFLIMAEIGQLFGALRGSEVTGDVHIAEVIFDAMALSAESYWLYAFGFSEKAKRYFGV